MYAKEENIKKESKNSKVYMLLSIVLTSVGFLCLALNRL